MRLLKRLSLDATLVDTPRLVPHTHAECRVPTDLNIFRRQNVHFDVQVKTCIAYSDY